MQQLTDIYGYCIIPKNTLLFRGHADASYNDHMFFATKSLDTTGFNDLLQVWETKKEIKVLFLIDCLNHNSHATSALPRLFNDVFPRESNSNFDDIENKRHNKLVRKLYEQYEISGWLSSLENGTALEICLFDKKANSDQLQLLQTVSVNNKEYFKNSLDKIKVFPPITFYDKTTQELNGNSRFPTRQIDHYKIYKEMIDDRIKGDIDNGKDRIKSEHDYFSLRTKLKV